jgi:hypothetical protein
LGAASGLGAFILVFLALWVSTLQSFPTGTRAEVKMMYRIVATETVVAFLAGITSVGSCVYWLTEGQGSLSYGLSLWMFVILLGLLLIAAIMVLWKLVWAS